MKFVQRAIYGLRYFSWVLFAVILLVALCEGISSLILIGRAIDWRGADLVRERIHTKHDSLLGWVNIPSLELPNAYGPGVRIRINGQGFRSDYDFESQVPEGKRRIICLGDSFTFGFGVSNGEAWCDRLREYDPRIETVNMGQGGYGVDQSYLWYKRDGLKLEHHVLVFAFITDDFDRMRYADFVGYAKPKLVLRGDTLDIEEAPTNPATFRIPWLTENMPHVMELRTVHLLARFRGARQNGPTHLRERLRTERDKLREIRELTVAILEELHHITKSNGRELVTLHLPMLEDYSQPISADWENYLEQELSVRGIPYLDLITEFKELNPNSIESYFTEGPYPHFSVKGNLWVAERLWSALKEHLPR